MLYLSRCPKIAPPLPVIYFLLSAGIPGPIIPGRLESSADNPTDNFPGGICILDNDDYLIQLTMYGAFNSLSSP